MKSLLLTLGAGLVAGLPSQPQSAPRDAEELPTLGLANITQIDMASGLQGRRLAGPFMGVDFPDPGIIWGDGSWKAYGTSSNGKKIPVATSSDTWSWSLTGNDALPNPGSWVDPNDQGIWAPDVQKNVWLPNISEYIDMNGKSVLIRLKGRWCICHVLHSPAERRQPLHRCRDVKFGVRPVHAAGAGADLRLRQWGRN